MPSTALTPTSRARLSPHLRLSFDPVRQRHVLLGPESVTVLNPTGAAIAQLCDGRTTTEVLDALRQRYAAVPEDEVLAFLERLAGRGAVIVDE
ncbi:pyrroloquinoline quinone biosynthesis peptide chaperone PqqD [Saccharopolyspora griseoalba]|uniref:Pyrroloquinoline quinone biosynthesis peptide chaperone PqqD n=1 Tax=Saccharopolyspora griseoalba TaxID=1431848 RepID=A0ABW2LKZ2_9PSEU